MFLPVHDEVLFDFPAADAVEFTREACEVMVDRTSFAVPLEVDASDPLEMWTKV
jgi:DNA polymerase I-like protein with 3'-5' exonuclease and polymerase domains